MTSEPTGMPSYPTSPIIVPAGYNPTAIPSPIPTSISTPPPSPITITPLVTGSNPMIPSPSNPMSPTTYTPPSPIINAAPSPTNPMSPSTYTPPSIITPPSEITTSFTAYSPPAPVINPIVVPPPPIFESTPSSPNPISPITYNPLSSPVTASPIISSNIPTVTSPDIGAGLARLSADIASGKLIPAGGYTDAQLSGGYYEVGTLKVPVSTYDQMTDEQKFQASIQGGLIPQGSEFVAGITQTEADKVNALVSQTPSMDAPTGIGFQGMGSEFSAGMGNVVKPMSWGFITPEAKAEQEQAFDSLRTSLLAGMAETKQQREQYESLSNTIKSYGDGKGNFTPTQLVNLYNSGKISKDQFFQFFPSVTESDINTWALTMSAAPNQSSILAKDTGRSAVFENIYNTEKAEGDSAQGFWQRSYADIFGLDKGTNTENAIIERGYYQKSPDGQSQKWVVSDLGTTWKVYSTKTGEPTLTFSNEADALTRYQELIGSKSNLVTATMGFFGVPKTETPSQSLARLSTPEAQLVTGGLGLGLVESAPLITWGMSKSPFLTTGALSTLEVSGKALGGYGAVESVKGGISGFQPGLSGWQRANIFAQSGLGLGMSSALAFSPMPSTKAFVTQEIPNAYKFVTFNEKYWKAPPLTEELLSAKSSNTTGYEPNYYQPSGIQAYERWTLGKGKNATTFEVPTNIRYTSGKANITFEPPTEVVPDFNFNPLPKKVSSAIKIGTAFAETATGVYAPVPKYAPEMITNPIDISMSMPIKTTYSNYAGKIVPTTSIPTPLWIPTGYNQSAVKSNVPTFTNELYSINQNKFTNPENTIRMTTPSVVNMTGLSQITSVKAQTPSFTSITKVTKSTVTNPVMLSPNVSKPSVKTPSIVPVSNKGYISDTKTTSQPVITTGKTTVPNKSISSYKPVETTNFKSIIGITNTKPITKQTTNTITTPAPAESKSKIPTFKQVLNPVVNTTPVTKINAIHVQTIQKPQPVEAGGGGGGGKAPIIPVIPLGGGGEPSLGGGGSSAGGSYEAPSYLEEGLVTTPELTLHLPKAFSIHKKKLILKKEGKRSAGFARYSGSRTLGGNL